MVSVFDIFKIGIGPSSSHTVGPMVAAGRFLTRLNRLQATWNVARVRATLYGSLAYTGLGHGTDRAILLGLSGERPDDIDPAAISSLLAKIAQSGFLQLGGHQPTRFDAKSDLVFDVKTPSPGHPNGLRLEAFDSAGSVLASRVYFSVGGGFVVPEDYHCQRRHAALCGSGGPAALERMISRPRDKDRGSEHDVAPGGGSGKPD